VARDREKMLRLEKLAEMSGIGNGMEVAHYDLECRGGGNLISKEQSGHIEHISPALYYDLLKESIALLSAKSEITGSAGVKNGTNGNTSGDGSSYKLQMVPQISINLPIHIPNKYLDSVRLRISIYRQIAELKNQAEMLNFTASLEDRFGRLDGKIQNLEEIVKLREFCIQHQIAEVKRSADIVTIKFSPFATVDVDKAIALAVNTSEEVAKLGIKIGADNQISFKLLKSKDNIALDIVESMKSNGVAGLVRNI
jgi:transcription-repair coupling factor (superfamily II helicase)